jgi:hypothetical protein
LGNSKAASDQRFSSLFYMYVHQWIYNVYIYIYVRACYSQYMCIYIYMYVCSYKRMCIWLCKSWKVMYINTCLQIKYKYIYLYCVRICLHTYPICAFPYSMIHCL